MSTTTQLGTPVQTKQTQWGQFGTLVTVFFFWGFVAASNDILIPVFKNSFNLSQAQSQLVAIAFYVAYTVGSMIYMGISKVIGDDILNKTGYKNGIAIGLIISALGTLMFIPAADMHSFTLMISGLFIVGLGFSLQQIAANPLAVVMGDPKTGSQRLSLAGGVNNFGTTIGPLVVSFAIFGSVGSTAAVSVASVKMPYLVLGAAFLAVALFFKFSSVPNKINLDKVAEEEAEDVNKVAHRSSALAYPQLWLGMIAIFTYVGVEVATASNLPAYMEQHLGIPTRDVAPYVSLYWASLMIGRWTASIGAFDFSDAIKNVLKFVMPFIAFGVFLAVNAVAGHDVTKFLPYAGIIVALIISDLLSKGSPAKMLLNNALLGVAALAIGMATSGMVSVFAFISAGLFCSTMWPCIFTLGVAGLGKHTNQGSSLLILMICGGGFVSFAQGYLADNGLGIHYSYLVGVLCFAYLAFYAFRTRILLKDQGIDYDVKITGGGH